MQAGTGSGSCTANYPAGTVVTLLATAATGSRFGGWTGACTGTGDCIVTLDQARSVSATFDLVPFTVDRSRERYRRGPGDRRSRRNRLRAGGRERIGRLRRGLPGRHRVTLTATASAGSSFSGWTGACTGTAACVVTVDQALTVSAGFALESMTLTVAGAGDGAGAVAASPDGIACTIAGGDRRRHLRRRVSGRDQRHPHRHAGVGLRLRRVGR